MARLLEFKKKSYNHRSRIDHNVNEDSVERVKTNCSILTAIIKSIEFCGRNGIAVCGHRDDGALTSSDISKKSRSLRSLINFRIDAGDQILENHLNSRPKTATHISKTTQNELLLCTKDFIQLKIVNEVKNQFMGPLYGIMVDEITDTSNKEQLGLVLRYTIGNNVVERLYEYVDCKSITGESVCRGIVSILESAQLLVSDCRAQTYDCARNMAAQQRGCAARFQRLASKALYFHCASHDLNLPLSKACDISDIQCILNDIKTVGILFKYSPEKQVLQEECV